MGINCLFLGHKIIDKRCIKCGKTLCEIKGHEWKYSNFKSFVYLDKSGSESKPSLRECTICHRKEKSAAQTEYDYPDWHRVE